MLAPLSVSIAAQESGTWHVLLAEVGVEAGTVAQFLIDREIEAPERYSAVQSYRVAMAVLRQQAAFVHVSVWSPCTRPRACV